jgi:hypothetical protein
LYYLRGGLTIIGFPSVAAENSAALFGGLTAGSSAVQEYKEIHTILIKNSFAKKLVFIKNQFKN